MLGVVATLSKVASLLYFAALSACAQSHHSCDFHIGKWHIDSQRTLEEYIETHKLERSLVSFEEPLSITLDSNTIEWDYSDGPRVSKYSKIKCNKNQLSIASTEYNDTLVDLILRQTRRGIAISGPDCKENPNQCTALLKRSDMKVCSSHGGCTPFTDADYSNYVVMIGQIPRVHWIYFNGAERDDA